MNQVLAKIYVQAAYETARTIYATRDEAIQATAYQLCMSVETVEEALKPAELTQ